MVSHGPDQLSASINYMEACASVMGKTRIFILTTRSAQADDAVLSENAPDWVRFNYQLPIVAIPLFVSCNYYDTICNFYFSKISNSGLFFFSR
jgi:hypothetical protein